MPKARTAEEIIAIYEKNERGGYNYYKMIAFNCEGYKLLSKIMKGRLKIYYEGTVGVGKYKLSLRKELNGRPLFC